MQFATARHSDSTEVEMLNFLCINKLFVVLELYLLQLVLFRNINLPSVM